MDVIWQPSAWGLRWGNHPAWQLQLQGTTLLLEQDGQHLRLALDPDHPLQIRGGLLWSSVRIRTGAGQMLVLHGLPRRQAGQLLSCVRAVEAGLARQDQGQRLHAQLALLGDWVAAADALLEAAGGSDQWITLPAQAALLARRDALPVAIDTLAAQVDTQLADGAEQRAAQLLIEDFSQDWRSAWEAANAELLARQQQRWAGLLARVEGRPLSDEQCRAVLSLDRRVLLVAAAGSGKTSTMVARAAYAVARGLAEPAQVLMLAFNRQAADELQQRSQQAFARVGLDHNGLQARTFHALGLQVIAQATGRKPHVPDWAVDANAGVKQLAELIDDLKDRSHDFRTRWDLFRLVFGHDLPHFGTALAAADGHDREGRPYARSLKGEALRSQEECLIANWLFYNGVDYAYEVPYLHDTATADRRQYHPDFHYPGTGLWHEHFALDAGGNPPPHFPGYAESVAWKRQLHRRHGTLLVETTSHQLRSGEAFALLSRVLSDAGVVLDPNPDRQIPQDGQPPLADAELINLMRCFISHAKSNALGTRELNAALEALPEDHFAERHRRFLALAIPVMAVWDDALARAGGIDFEDMLNLAAGLVEQGRWSPPWRMILADEFQDASRARARLCRALADADPGNCLLAVGDDWQSINRFAGADVSVMTDAAHWFGQVRTLQLTRTFRCPQALCDVAGDFVQKNPSQLRKRVQSDTAAHGPVLEAFQLDSREQLTDAVRQLLGRLARQLADGQTPPGRDGKLRVFVLGRYNAERACVPPDWQAAFGRWLQVEFLTMHRSKGAEADYVIIPGMLDRRFPSLRADDAVLSLAMPGGDAFPLGEERRLFYVALTRARRRVSLLTVRGQCSPFLDELVRDGAVEVTDLAGRAVSEQRCPACGNGVIVLRSGPYGQFHSCSGYPRCAYKPPQQHRSSHSRPARAH